MEHPISAMPRTPFPASRDFPSRGNERYEGKNSESYTSRTISAFSLFGGCRHHLARWEACHMTQKGKSRNADFILITRRAIHNPRPERPSNLRTLRPSGRSILRTFTPQVCPRPIHLKNLSLHNPSTQPAAIRRPQPSGQRPVNPHARRACPGAQPRQLSRQRRVPHKNHMTTTGI